MKYLFNFLTIAIVLKNRFRDQSYASKVLSRKLPEHKIQISLRFVKLYSGKIKIKDSGIIILLKLSN